MGNHGEKPPREILFADQAGWTTDCDRDAELAARGGNDGAMAGDIAIGAEKRVLAEVEAALAELQG
jgi:hypothetical protein